MTIIDMDKVGEALNTKADIDLNNTGVFSTNGGGVNLTSSTPNNASGKEVTSADFIKSDIQSNLLNYTTNRILEIPQDIKLELNDGTLTLKAGSKLRRLTGEEFITEKDISLNTSYYGFNQTCLIIPSPDTDLPNTGFETPNISICSSGITIPTSTAGQYHWFFKVDTKEYYWTSDNGTTWERRAYSEFFPIAIAKVGAGKWTSIEQVFNGFGYIGSTAFALPGVKYQFADGRNEDRTYKSITKTFDNVSLVSYAYQIQGTERQPLSINDQGILVRTYKYVMQNNQPVIGDSVWYKPETNETFRSNAFSVFAKSREIIIATGISTNSAFNITSFEPLEVPTINSYQRTELAGMGMPGDKYIDLTPGASGTTYTAPANGWFSAMNGNGKNGFCCLLNSTKKIGSSNPAAQGISDGMSFVPVIAGDTVVLKYSGKFNELNYGWFCFIYAQGDQ